MRGDSIGTASTGRRPRRTPTATTSRFDASLNRKAYTTRVDLPLEIGPHMAHLKSSAPSHAPLCMFVRCCGDCAYKRFLTTILGDRLCEAFSQESGERDLASLLTTLTLEPQCQSESSIPNWSAHSVSASTKWLARPSHDCNTIARDGGHEMPSGHRLDNQLLPPSPAKGSISC